jgi:hypothetical protein
MRPRPPREAVGVGGSRTYDLGSTLGQLETTSGAPNVSSCVAPAEHRFGGRRLSEGVVWLLHHCPYAVRIAIPMRRFMSVCWRSL